MSLYLCFGVVLAAADHGAELGEQDVDRVLVPLLGLQPGLVRPLGAEPLQCLPAEVVLLRLQLGARQDPEAGVIRPNQQVGDVSVAPELSNVIGGLRGAVHRELVTAD